jgi:hypothetical protein
VDNITVQMYVERIMHKPGFPMRAISKKWYSSLTFMFIGWCLPSFTAMSIKITVFWTVTPCSLVDGSSVNGKPTCLSLG